MSPEEILACATAFELFGEAVLDRRGLKRAYAQLIRTWDPDGHPEVFTHIRALYEAARDGDTGAPEEEEPRAPFLRLVRGEEAPPEAPEEESEPEQSPAQRLQQAMKEAHADEALELLARYDLDIRIDRPDVWFATVATLADARTFHLPAATLQSWRDAIESAPEHMPEPLLERIELLTNTGLAFQEATQDPDVSPAVLELLRHWGKGPLDVAKAFMALSEALPDDLEAWSALTLVRERYPALWFPFTLMTNVVTREVDRFDEAAAPELHDEPCELLLVGATPRLVAQRRRIDNLRLAAGLLLLLAFPVALWLQSGIGMTVAVAGAIGFAILTVVLLRHDAKLRARDYQQAQPALVDYAREHVLYDNEVLDLALPPGDEPPPLALLRWQQDPTTLMRVLTPAHLARIEARLAEPASEPEAQAPPSEPSESSP